MALEHLEQHLHLQSQQGIIEEDQPELSLEIPIFLRSDVHMMDSNVKCCFWAILRGIMEQGICEKHLLPWFVFYLEIITLQPE